MYKVNILVVEKNTESARRITEALKQGKSRLEVQVMTDGVEAMNYLHHKGAFTSAVSPDVIILELNLKGKDGREVLAEIKHDDELKRIPVLVFTESGKIDDVEFSYENYANSYIIKPQDSEGFSKAAKHLEAFWFRLVKLPSLAGSRY
jgi:chemotaxis family two-component system response regulator Rcp1